MPEYQAPTMKTKQEVLDMVERFDHAEEADDLSDAAATARAALNWVLGHNDGPVLTDLLVQ